jgi:hypothetical protein
MNRHEHEVAVASDRTMDSNPCEHTCSVHDGGVLTSARTLIMAQEWYGRPAAAAERGP